MYGSMYVSNHSFLLDIMSGEKILYFMIRFCKYHSTTSF